MPEWAPGGAPLGAHFGAPDGASIGAPFLSATVGAPLTTRTATLKSHGN